jgi:hypothetical protein
MTNATINYSLNCFATEIFTLNASGSIAEITEAAKIYFADILAAHGREFGFLINEGNNTFGIGYYSAGHDY